MNGYTVAFFIIAVLVLILLIIIRDAITVDPAKAKAALQNAGARIAGLFSKKAP